MGGYIQFLIIFFYSRDEIVVSARFSGKIKGMSPQTHIPTHPLMCGGDETVRTQVGDAYCQHIHTSKDGNLPVSHWVLSYLLVRL